MSGTLIAEFTFQAFAIRSRNRFAHAAAVAVAETPGQAYNPLFIYGGPPADRTHLLHAIGNYAQELHASLKICYVRAAEFGRQFAVTAGGSPRGDQYLGAGMLLVDDVQLLPDTKASQAEFLRVITAMERDGGQVVISCDRAPRLLTGMDDGLRDRLNWGLVVEMADGIA